LSNFANGGEAMVLYGERKDAARLIHQIAMPRLPRLYAPSGTVHVVARCNMERRRRQIDL